MHAPLPKPPAKMPVERPRARRERRSASARRPVLHVVAPGLEVAQAVPRKGETVTAFLRRTGWATRDPRYGWQFRKRLPTILEVNGEAVLRKDWRRTKIAANDNVRFVSFPRGGGKQGKQVLGLVALVAVAAFAAWAGPAVAAGLGLTGTAATIAGGIVTGAIGLGGALLVNALVAPKQGATNDGTPTDQIYTASASGNRARLGQPMPVWYGRNKDYPDFAATPWGEFQGNDQYLNVLLSVSMGSMDYEQLLISDTPFWNPTDGVLPAFSSAQVEFYEPNAAVTLFPVNVTQSDEVSGQQLPHDYSYVGPYVANAPATTAYQLAVDYVFPAGCYTTNDEGETTAFSVTVVADRQKVDDAGAPIGDWTELGSVTRSYASRSPIRETMLVGVPEGRYQVRFRRTSDVPADNKGAAEVVWAGLRAYLRGDNTFPVSTIAIRIKATETTQGSYKFGVIGTRKLPVWNGSTFVLQATRNPAWALLDMATNAQYGAEVQSAKVDFNTLVNHAAGCVSRGDSFDYVFKSAVAVPEAFDTALIPSRARHMWLGDTLSLVRDQWDPVPTMMLTDREIVRDSTSFEYTMLGEEDPDAVIIEYIDENTWLPATVQYPPNTEIFTATRPETKRVNGIVNRNHAFRECAFYYLCSIYRREAGSIGCEYEGRAITMGATLRLQSELPQDYGFAGAVTERDGLTLTLDPAPEWAAGETHYIRLRRPNGKEFGPVRATKGDTDAEALLNSVDLATVESQQGVTLTNVLLRADGGEYPTYALGTADNQSKLVKVLTGQPNGETFTLSIVVDDERVHATDLGDPPILPVGQFPKNDSSPLIVGLNARFGQGVAEPQLTASWFPTAGAFYYRAEVSYDGGNSWVEVYQGSDTKFEKFVTLGALTLRVQAVGQFPGPWSQVPVEAPTIEIMSNAVAFKSLNEAIRQQTTELLDNRFADVWKQIAITNKNVQQALSRTFIDKKEVRSQQTSLYGSNKALIENVKTTAADADAAMAENIDRLFAGANGAEGQINQTAQVAADAHVAVGELSDEVIAKIGPSGSITSAVSEHASSIAQIDGYAAGKWAIGITVDSLGRRSVAGIVLFTDSDDTSSFTINASQFFVTFPNASGGDPIPVFTIANVNGVAKVALRGDMFVDGDVVTRMIAAGAITTVTLDALSVNTSKLAINSVGIDQIIANAVTNTVPFYFSSPGGVYTPDLVGYTPLTICTGTVNIQGGAATVRVCSYWAQTWFGSFSSDPGLLSCGFGLEVDGTLRRAFCYPMQLNKGYSQAAIQRSFTEEYTVTGLSAGNHTFRLRSLWLSASHGGPGNEYFLPSGTPTSAVMGDGQMFVSDFRR